MDPAFPLTDHGPDMPRHLRPVPSPSDAVYVVSRSAYVRPGAPFVVSQCLDDAVAAALSLAGLEVYGRGQMEGQASLAEALAAWDAGDHGLHRRERAARRAFGAPAPSTRRLPHPSLLGKLLPSVP
jgi:hypothetical protein